MRRPHLLGMLLGTLALWGCNASGATASKKASAPVEAVTVTTAKGPLTFEPRDIENGECTSDECVDYMLVDGAPDGIALVQRLYYEGSDVLLIDLGSGAQTALPGHPHFDTANARLVVLNPDEMGDGSNSGSFVYEKRGGTFAQAAHFGMEALMPTEFVRWATSDCADIKGYTGWGQPGFDTSVEKNARLSRSESGQWELQTGPCAGTK